MFLLATSYDSDFWQSFAQYCLIGLTNGALIALIALGYTMVYGIVELINFAHGDLFMLGTFMGLTILAVLGINVYDANDIDPSLKVLSIFLMFLIVPIFCGAVNWGVDRLVYRPLRNAPKLAPLVSAIGVSFLFMNIGLFWNAAIYERNNANEPRKPVAAASPRAFPGLIPARNILADDPTPVETKTKLESTPTKEEPKDKPKEKSVTTSGGNRIQFTYRDLLVLGLTVPIMIALTIFVKFTSLGKAMRATAQNPTAARLMGINVDRVIGITFILGGVLGGISSVMFALYYNTTSYQIGFQQGLYAFTAAVLGGIGNIPGAVLGGLVIGLVRALGGAYVGENWSSAIVFAILIVILVFRPSGLLGVRTREKV